jgi:ribosome biogenesis GTPase
MLPRRTILARRVDAGHEQVLAVNVDIAFLGTSLNENFNLRRLERYLTLAREAGVKPVVLLTKADLCDEAAPYVEEVQSLAGRDDGPLAAHPISVVSGDGMDAVRGYLQPGVTAVILGSSGIGKSTLVNYLAEADIQDMMEAREFDDKGRHCTTFRHLVKTPTGGLIIDTPGLRGLTLGEASDALAATFADIEALAATCRFTNCQHETEPGCAIKAALEAGTLAPDRLDGYLRLQREVAAMARRENRVEERKAKKLEKKQSAQLNKKLKQKWGDRYRR